MGLLRQVKDKLNAGEEVLSNKARFTQSKVSSVDSVGMMALTVYGDTLSQPTRAVVLLCLANKIPYELKVADFTKKEHKLPEFKELNPRSEVPVIDDGGFILAESTTILRYIASSRHLSDHWYPTEVKSRARVDYLLDWYHSNIHQTAEYVFQKELVTNLWKEPIPPEEIIKAAEQRMIASMDLVEGCFLKPEKGPFLLGASEPSIADIIFACEYTQTRFLVHPEQEKLMHERPKTMKWLDTVEKRLAPYFGEAHKTLPDLIMAAEFHRASLRITES
ncbi:hypothetical protein R1flu_018064 [Riccia fluitans]|uniref:Glutathione S-transferase n=1 Tax=Riccia fluitans TaxID=41844 RepID=A0ABD1ZER3_9MARC